MLSILFAWLGAPSQEGGQSNPLIMLLPWVLIFVVIYFLMLRPQIKRQKQHRAMIGAVQKGDKVVAAGGIIGTIAGIKEKENTILLKVDDNIKIEVSKSSISSVMRKE